MIFHNMPQLGAVIWWLKRARKIQFSGKSGKPEIFKQFHLIWKNTGKMIIIPLESWNIGCIIVLKFSNFYQFQFERLGNKVVTASSELELTKFQVLSPKQQNLLNYELNVKYSPFLAPSHYPETLTNHMGNNMLHDVYFKKWLNEAYIFQWCKSTAKMYHRNI